MDNIFDKSDSTIGDNFDGNLSNDENAMQQQLADDLNTSRSDSDMDLMDNDEDSRDAALAIEENLKDIDTEKSDEQDKSHEEKHDDSGNLDISSIELPSNDNNIDNSNIDNSFETDIILPKPGVQTDLPDNNISVKEKKKDAKSKKELEEEEREKMQ